MLQVPGIIWLLLCIWLVLGIVFGFLYERPPKPLILAIVIIVVILLLWFVIPLWPPLRLR